MQLYLSNPPLGTVWWDDISFEQIPPPGPRPVTVVSVNYVPVNAHSAEESVDQFFNVASKAVGAKADVILLPEAVTPPALVKYPPAKRLLPDAARAVTGPFIPPPRVDHEVPFHRAM